MAVLRSVLDIGCPVHTADYAALVVDSDWSVVMDYNHCSLAVALDSRHHSVAVC